VRCEGAVLTAWLECLSSFSLTHTSLHFDGVRIAGDFGDGIDDVIAKCVAHIDATTGFKVNIRAKEHLTFLASAAKVFGKADSTVDVPQSLLRAGNCIPAALWNLVGWGAGAEIALGNESDVGNISANRRKARSYRDVAKMWGVTLVHKQDTTSWPDGDYLLHAEGSGHPHGVAVHKVGNEVSIMDGADRFTGSFASFQACLLSQSHWYPYCLLVGHCHVCVAVAPAAEQLAIATRLQACVNGAADNSSVVVFVVMQGPAGRAPATLEDRVLRCLVVVCRCAGIAREASLSGVLGKATGWLA
jgi:hypothetical protein